MGKFGNMEALSFLSRDVLTSLAYQNVYRECGGSLKNHRLTGLVYFWGATRIEKIVWERCARQKNFS